MARKKTITYDPFNYQSGMASTIYANGKTKIRKTKTVVRPHKIKTVEYGPISYYGKQVKTKTKKKF